MKKYRIIDITDLNGNTRYGNIEYRERIRNTVNILLMEEGYPIVFGYVSDEYNNKKYGVLRTSILKHKEYIEERTLLKAITLNSIYYIKEMVSD